MSDLQGDLDKLTKDLHTNKEIMSISGGMNRAEVLAKIKKNIALQTRGRSSEEGAVLNNFSQEIAYYNFEGETGEDNSLGNKGKNLKIQAIS